jgi:hypothetical protein
MEKLAGRRDLLLSLARGLLIATTLVWLGMMAFYDQSADTMANPSILLSTETAYLLPLGGIGAIDQIRIWGGPSTLFGLQALIMSLAVVSVAAFLRAWLNRGRISRLGLVLAPLAIVLAIATAGTGSNLMRPAAVTPANFDRLTALIDARQPGLIARLKAGQRPAFPKRSGGRSLTVSADKRLVAVIPPGAPLIRDQEDVEGLRLGLASRAYIAGDIPALRRLLPIDLETTPAEMPARNDFARRLIDMGNAAGVAPVPAAQRQVTAARAATWHAILGWVRTARILLQVMLWSGLSCLVIGLILRWSHGRITAKAARLAELQAPATRKRTASGVTPI